MQRHNDLMLLKVKLILIAGPCVYAEHKTVHADAKERATRMVALFNTGEETTMTVCLEEWCVFLERIKEVYVKNTREPQQSVLEALEESERGCLRWALAIPSKKIPRRAWTRFREVFKEKQHLADLLLTGAEKAHVRYAFGCDLSHKLSVNQAVTAWCVELPEIK